MRLTKHNEIMRVLNLRLKKHKYNEDIAVDVINLLTRSGRLVGEVKLVENGGTWVWIGDTKTKNAAEVNITSVRQNRGWFWDKWYTLKIASMIVYTIGKRSIK